MSSFHKEQRILIVGAGTFGLSTAYHLARSGHYTNSNITVLEKGEDIPAPLCAGNDINKIIRADYSEPFYVHLALSAIKEWSTNPIFSPHYRQVGYLLGNSGQAPEESRVYHAKALASTRSHAAFTDGGVITEVSSREDVKALAPAVAEGPGMDGFTGHLNRLAGYAYAADAIRDLHKAVVEMGVKVVKGDGVASLCYDTGHGPSARRCTGVKTESGKTYTADTTILTLGASLGTVLPDIGRQIVAKTWPIAHVQLTTEEAQKLKDIPVTFPRDLGFLFEPDRSTNLLKISHNSGGYTNYNEQGMSLPLKDNNFLPKQDEEAVRNVLRAILPELADRPLVKCKMCWCADTADSEYILDYVPGTQGLIVATGDSGHAFKMLPVVGGWIKELLERGEQREARWKWKEGLSAADADVKWRVGPVRDIKEIMSGATLVG